MLKYIRHVFLFLFLTVLSQIGGLVYILYIIIEKRLKLQSFLRKMSLFIGLYLIFSLLLTPLFAKQFGRKPLPLIYNKQSPVIPASVLSCLLNRHYVVPELEAILIDVSHKMGEEIQIVYLDANFPFWDGFPLLPHKSHEDGEKVDIAFIYQSKSHQYLNDGKGFLGYGKIEAPLSDEYDQAHYCEQKGYWQYSILSKIVRQNKSSTYPFSLSGNRKLLKYLANDDRVGKIFLEPHLKVRMGLDSYDKIRFHGCGAVRHDDHIHIQMKPGKF